MEDGKITECWAPMKLILNYINWETKFYIFK